MEEHRHEEQYTLAYGGEDDLAQVVGWSPDGRHIALGGTGGSVEIWSLAPPRRTLTYHGQVGERITALCWSPDATKIASTGPGGAVRVWNAATGMDLPGAQWQGITAVAWSPDGDHLALVHIDGTVRLTGWGGPPQEGGAAS